MDRLSPRVYLDPDPELTAESGSRVPTQEALVSYITNTHSFTVSGYQRLPSGLIIQWGHTVANTSASGGTTITLPTTFPNTYLAGVGTHLGNGALNSTINAISFLSTSQMKIATDYGVAIDAYWIAVGY